MEAKTFIAELTKNASDFGENMAALGDRRDQSYPDWHRDFTRWCEVGTEMEAEYYPPPEPVHRPTASLKTDH
jgi:hypothetical protein